MIVFEINEMCVHNLEEVKWATEGCIGVTMYLRSPEMGPQQLLTGLDAVDTSGEQVDWMASLLSGASLTPLQAKSIAARLTEAGFATPGEVAGASHTTLMALGIEEVNAHCIIAACALADSASEQQEREQEHGTQATRTSGIDDVPGAVSALPSTGWG
jgi:hypothetical protein